MTIDEIIFTIGHIDEVRDALYQQLKEIEGRDLDLAYELTIKIDIVCGLMYLIENLPIKHFYVINDTYFKSSNKPRSYSAADQLQAMQALMQRVHTETWDLSFYRSWRRWAEMETCPKK